MASVPKDTKDTICPAKLRADIGSTFSSSVRAFDYCLNLDASFDADISSLEMRDAR